MGSWNGTCGLSQLPIMYGDKVILFLLQKTDKEMKPMGCVYSDALFNPVSQPILAYYNDYGKVINSEVDIRTLRNLYKNTITIDEYDVDELINNGEYYVMLVHYEIYENIIDYYGNQKDFFTENLLIKDFIKKEILDYLKATNKLSTFEIMMNSELDFNHFKIQTNTGLRFYQNPELYSNNFTEDILVEKLTELLIFKYIMEVSRKLWQPQTGLGAQDQEYELAKIIGHFAAKKENMD